MITRRSFYNKVVNNWIPDKSATILVVGGGITDWEVLTESGYKNVIITNVDTRTSEKVFAPYSWCFQNAEMLSYEDQSFDYVIVNAALHHCSSPHRALVEMYRVSKKALVAIEARDCYIRNILNYLHLSSNYEIFAVYDNDSKYGGVNNSEIPNYVYRWTESEVRKTIQSYAPFVNHHIEFSYGSDIPHRSMREKKGKAKTILVRILVPAYSLFTFFFPRQQNLFAFMIQKPNLSKDMFPWLKFDNGKITFNHNWAKSIYESRNLHNSK